MNRTSWLLATLAGCSLTAKSAPIEYRYFAPAMPAASSTPHETCSRLRLGRVRSSDHLRYRIAHRRSQVEVELYDTLRWTERPEDYVRRALDQSLFDERGFQRALGDAAPTVEVEITAFEEVERGSRRLGRIELRYQLADERDVLDTQTVSIEREAKATEIASVISAIGDALTAATDELGDRLARRLCR